MPRAIQASVEQFQAVAKATQSIDEGSTRILKEVFESNKAFFKLMDEVAKSFAEQQ